MLIYALDFKYFILFFQTKLKRLWREKVKDKNFGILNMNHPQQQLEALRVIQIIEIIYPLNQKDVSECVCVFVP